MLCLEVLGNFEQPPLVVMKESFPAELAISWRHQQLYYSDSENVQHVRDVYLIMHSVYSVYPVRY